MPATSPAADSPAPRPRKRLGLTIASYWARSGSKTANPKFPAWKNALEVLDHCHELGAGCLQTGVGGWESDFAGKVRARREALGLVLEGQIGLPRSEADVPRFETSVRAAKEAGAVILRTTCLSGRRYETFDSAEAWEGFREQSWKSLTLAEAVVRRHGTKLAVENHKDWRAAEQVDLLRRLGSEHVGVTLDLGNNLALLEDPLEVIEALAPLALTTHFKDMAVQETADGFLLSEVPLGDGLLDLPKIITMCERANPAVQFNLEMITRDPLAVPCLGRKYWATCPDYSAADLARGLALVKRNPPRAPLPVVRGRPPEDVLAFEEANIVKCFAYAREKLCL